MTQQTTIVRTCGQRLEAYAERDSAGRVTVRVWNPLEDHYTVCHSLTPAQERYVIGRTLPRRDSHPSYMRRQDRGWIVCHWDQSVQCYRESEERPYEVARAQVGAANCRDPKHCTIRSHEGYHQVEE